MSAASGLAAAALLLGGCGGPMRSAAAFCSTLHSEKQRILAEFNASANSGSSDQLVQVLSGLGASLQALGELRTYFHKLSDVAPDEIKDDAEIVAKDWDQQVADAANQAAHPLSALAGALINGATMSGQLNTLNQFALSHCHESI
jgi:hypothetical protein